MAIQIHASSLLSYQKEIGIILTFHSRYSVSEALNFSIRDFSSVFVSYTGGPECHRQSVHFSNASDLSNILVENLFHDSLSLRILSSETVHQVMW
jgi:hypothetical protein